MKCNSDMLWTLVQQIGDPHGASDVIMDHIESCVTCRKTLNNLGGDEPLWDEARECLSDIDSFPPATSDWQPLPAIDLSFLDESSHPEMLGRIGRYDVESVLGRGGMGIVFRGYDSDLHRTVAIKAMAPEWAGSMAARERFAREAQAAASVSHQNVIPIYNVEPEADLPFLVMRYIRGQTLQRWVKNNAPLDVDTILRIASQLSEGLSAAHRRGLIHRDIKPANVMVGDNTDQAWITDFGLARAADSTTLTQTGVIAGTPHYMSPEQTRGEPIDQRADLFSLGCVFYFLCANRPPLDADNTLAVLHRIVTDDPDPLTSVRNDLPPALVTLVHRMLDRSPRQRPKDCEAVSRDLTMARDEFANGKVARPVAASKVRLWGLAGMLVALLVAFCVRQAIWPAEIAPSRSVYQPPAAEIGRMLSNAGKGTTQRIAATPTASPYVARASEQIDRYMTLDQQAFKRRVAKIEQEIDRLQKWSPPLAVPTSSESDEWRKDVGEIERSMMQLEQSNLEHSSNAQ